MNIEKLKKSVSLEGKVAIVTGASRPNGQGRAAAKLLAIRGARVVVTDVAEPIPEMMVASLGMGSAELLEDAVADIKDLGGEAVAVPVDVTQPEDINVCVENTIAVFGGIDILINNAGVFVGGYKPTDTMSGTDWDVSYKVHMKGAADFSVAVIPHMKKRGGGAIVNNASSLAGGGIANMAAYGATKTGLIGLTKCLADEYGADNIRVNCVCPGNTWTDISPAEAELMVAAGFFNSPEDAVKTLEGMCAMGRYGRPEEIAEAMVFLVSPAASFINGATLRVNGGYKGILT